MDMHHCVALLKEACSLVQNGGFVSCPKHRRERGFKGQKGGLMGSEEGARFEREPNVDWHHMHKCHVVSRFTLHIYVHIVVDEREIMVMLFVY